MMARARSFVSCVLATLVVSTAFPQNDASAVDLKTSTEKNRTAAQEKSTKEKPDKQTARRTIDKELEQGVLEMVDNHLPDIKVLLDQLRDKKPPQYDLAIRNLAKSSRRLQWAKKRGQEAFELEVHVLQAQSSINLLIAKLKLRDDKQDRQALRHATMQFEDATIARAKHEVTLLQSRLAKMQEQVSTAEKRLSEKQSKTDETIEKSFQTYLRKSGRK